MKYNLMTLNISDLKPEGIPQLEALANEGNVSALFLGSEIMEACYGLTKVDHEYSHIWAKAGAERRDPLCQARYAYLLYEKLGIKAEGSEGFKHIKEARAWIMAQAENGHPHAQALLGWMYIRGAGVQKNYQTGIEWLKKTAHPTEDGKPGNAFAQYILGEYYSEDGQTLDYAEAEKWYLLAASQGHAIAQAEYARVIDIDERYEEGRKWFLKSARQGYVAAYNYLGRWYELNETEKNPELAQKRSYRWHNLAAGLGYIDSILTVARYEATGFGVSQSIATAYKRYKDLLTRKGNTFYKVGLTPSGTKEIERRLLQLQLPPTRRISAADNPRQKGWEFRDGSQVWEAPLPPVDKTKKQQRNKHRPHNQK